MNIPATLGPKNVYGRTGSDGNSSPDPSWSGELKIAELKLNNNQSMDYSKYF
jgi:hypothetical protein